MAIKKATAFTASDGSIHSSIEEAQQRELALLWLSNTKLDTEVPEADAVESNREAAVNFASSVVKMAPAILDILTTGPRSRPGARKVKGTTAPKRAAKATPEQAKAGIKAMREAVDREADNAGDMAAERLRQMPAEAATT